MERKRLLTIDKRCLRDSASTLVLHERGTLLLQFFVSFTNKILVAGIVLLFIRSDMFLTTGPGVGRSSPGAIGLDGNVILASDNTNKTLLTELLSPRVPDGPILGSILNTVANNGDIVNNVLVTSGIFEDTRGVVLKSIGDGDTTCNRSTLVDLLHHGLLTRDLSVLVNLVSVVLIRDEASLTGHAVLALEHGAALNTIIVTTSSIDGTSFVCNVIVMHPLEGIISLTTVATIIT